MRCCLSVVNGQDESAAFHTRSNTRFCLRFSGTLRYAKKRKSPVGRGFWVIHIHVTGRLNP